MLPHARVRRRRTRIIGLAALSLALFACGTDQSPESRVRAVIEDAETAAEARDVSALVGLVSPAYRDDRGGGRDELERYLRGYMVAHQSVHVLTRVDSVEFPYRDIARVELTVGTLGRESAAATAFDVAGDVHDVVLELQLEDDEWRVLRAEWRPATRG